MDRNVGEACLAPTNCGVTGCESQIIQLSVVINELLVDFSITIKMALLALG